MSFEITVKRTIHTSPDVAFNAFTDGPTWSKWFSDYTTVDFRIGGRFSNDDGDSGEYLAIEKNQLLRFTWEGSFKGSQIELLFKPIGSAISEVTLRHYQLAAQADADKMKTCWSWTLANLASFLEVGKPLPMSEWKAMEAERASSVQA